MKFYPPSSPASYLFNNYIRNGKCFAAVTWFFGLLFKLVVFFPIKEILLLALTSKWQCVCGTRILNAGQKTWMSNKRSEVEDCNLLHCFYILTVKTSKLCFLSSSISLFSLSLSLSLRERERADTIITLFINLTFKNK